MATRLYFPSTGSAPCSPNYGTVWTDTTIAQRRPLARTKGTTGIGEVTFTDANDVLQYILFRQYVSDPVQAQTFSAVNFKFVFLCKETSTSNNMKILSRVHVVSGDGLTLRGTLAVDTRYLEFNTSYQSRICTGASGSVVAQAGDRLVVEIGVSGDPANNANHNCSMEMGDSSGTDCPYDETQTDTALVPWIESSANILWQSSDVTASVNCLALSATARAVTVSTPTNVSTEVALMPVSATLFAVTADGQRQVTVAASPLAGVLTQFSPTVVAQQQPIVGVASLDVACTLHALSVQTQHQVSVGLALMQGVLQLHSPNVSAGTDATIVASCKVLTVVPGVVTVMAQQQTVVAPGTLPLSALAKSVTVATTGSAIATVGVAAGTVAPLSVTVAVVANVAAPVNCLDVSVSSPGVSAVAEQSVSVPLEYLTLVLDPKDPDVLIGVRFDAPVLGTSFSLLHASVETQEQVAVPLLALPLLFTPGSVHIEAEGAGRVLVGVAHLQATARAVELLTQQAVYYDLEIDVLQMSELTRITVASSELTGTSATSSELRIESVQ